MPNPKSPNEDQDEIRNAADRVVVVATRFALPEYRNYSAYICLPHRYFRQCVRMAFYTKNKIYHRIPKILGHIEAISRDEIETRADLMDVERGRLKALLRKMEPARSEEWDKRQLKIVFLSPSDSPDTLVLPEDIDNTSPTSSSRGTAFTQSQRYVSLSRLERDRKRHPNWCELFGATLLSGTKHMPGRKSTSQAHSFRPGAT